MILDFETANPDGKLLKTGGAWKYSEDPLTEILCVVFAPDPGQKYFWAPSRRGNEDVLRRMAEDPRVRFVSHGEFEIAIWRNIMVEVHGFPPVANERWHDTMAVAATKGLPLALENLCEALHLTVAKDMEGRRFTLALSKNDDRTDAAIERVIRYCDIDVDAEFEAHRALGWLPKEERTAYRLHQRMNHRGVRIDLPFIAAAQKVVTKASVPLVKRFVELTGFKPTQTRKLAAKFELYNKHGKISFDAETIAEALAKNRLGPDVREALEIRQLIGSSSIKKLGRMAACVCADGRARGLSQFHGAHPGRSTGRLFQPYNFPRGVLKTTPEQTVDVIMTGDPDYVQCVLGEPPIKAVASSLRHAIVPELGYVFLAGDYKSIQLRIALVKAGQTDKLALASPYIDMAERIYKRPIDRDKDPEEYHIGKCAVLGLQFGMGWKRFKQQFAPKESDGFCEKVTKIYRYEWAPEMPGCWYELQDLFEAMIRDHQAREWRGIQYEWNDGWITARLPSGRKLWYRNPRKIGDQLCVDGARTVDTVHGGLLFENLVMGIEVDIQRHGWTNCEAAGFPIVMEVYDQLVAEVPEESADLEAFKRCMIDMPDWVTDLGIPVAADCWMGHRYRK